ncbi:hypothetical protein GCM10008967_09560 [Bacillus carboniphilus]|uniref:N-acetyltransferase domain-containing protein n=1 Tax=Bacillus carboniphilus TaxID=86663 RepID=A0ABN0VZH8_9BACI
MVPILEELTKGKIEKAIRENFEDFYKMAPKNKFKYLEKDGVKWVSSVLPHPLFNRVVATDCSKEELPNILNEISQYFQAKKLPFLWMNWTGVDQSDSLISFLEENGFWKIIFTIGMALRLEKLRVPQPKVKGLEIVEVKSDKDFAIFMEVLQSGFEATDEIAQGYQVMNKAILEKPEHGTHYLASYKGKVVAVSSVIYGSGVAGIYNVSTLKRARGKGFGRAVTFVPLLEAKSKGYKLAVLHSSVAGYNVYKGLGFEEYYEIGLYMRDSEI